MYLDGTKMQAEMKATDAAEDAQHGKNYRGDELPSVLQGKPEHLAQLGQATERLELAAAAGRVEQAQKLATRAEEEQQCSKNDAHPLKLLWANL